VTHRDRGAVAGERRAMRCGHALELAGLGVNYGATPVFSGLDLAIEAGETVAVIGPSGCGKSTLLRCIAGLLEPTSGTVRLGGEVVASVGHSVPPERRGVGFVFQSFALWPHMTIRDNVAYPWKVRGVPAGERASRAEAALGEVGLGGMGDRFASQLSGGQQQRVALARALAGGPRLLALDEPLSSVDAALREELQGVISRLVGAVGVTTLLATHDRDEAAALADRIVVLDRGAVAQSGTVFELHDSPASPFVAQFMGATNVVDVVVAERRGVGALLAVEGACGLLVASEALDAGRGPYRAGGNALAGNGVAAGWAGAGGAGAGGAGAGGAGAGGAGAGGAGAGAAGAGAAGAGAAGAGAAALKGQRAVLVVWPDQVPLGDAGGAGLPGVVERVTMRSGHLEVSVRVGRAGLRSWAPGRGELVAGETVTVSLGRCLLFPGPGGAGPGGAGPGGAGPGGAGGPA